MTETKKQHFLPYAYLKYFKIPDSTEGRQSARIFRDDGDSVNESLVANQGYKKWFYRRENTQESEAGFNQYEMDWSRCVSDLREGRFYAALLFMQILMYHFRNISIVNDSSMDRYEAVALAVKIWIEQHVIKCPDGKEFTADSNHVTNFPWEVRLIKFGHKLITSDNPSVLTVNSERDGTYGPFILPVSPTELLVAIDPAQYKYKRDYGNEADAILANSYVAAQSVRHIYYHEQMPDQLRENLWEFIRSNRASTQFRGKLKESRFIPGHPIYADTERNSFTFISRVGE